MENYYLRYPTPDGKGYDYVQVDASRLDRGTLQLFQRVAARGQSFKYMRVNGQETFFERPMDTHGLTDLLYDFEQQCNGILDTCGEAGQLVKAELMGILNLQQVLQAIANSDELEAISLLKEKLYSFMSGISTIADKLCKTDQVASGMTVAYDNATQALENSDSIALVIYKPWADCAKWIAITHDEIVSLRQQLTELKERAEAAKANWESMLTMENQCVADAIQFLKLKDNCFLEELYCVLGGAPPDPGFKQQVEEARRHLGAIAQAQKDAQQLFTQSQTDIRDDLDQHATVLKQVMVHWHTQIGTFDWYQQFAKNGVLKPPHLFLPGKYIDTNEYEFAELVAASEDWRPQRLGNELELLVASIERLFYTPPQLTEHVADVVQATERYLGMLPEILEAEPQPEPTHEPAEPAPQSEPGESETFREPEPLTPPLAAEPSGPQSAQPPLADLEDESSEIPLPVPESYDEARAQELYELIICAGYVITCNDKFIASSSVNSLLETVQLLKKCSKDEAGTFAPVLRTMVADPTQSENLKGEKAPVIKKRWELSTKTWLIYDVNQRSARRNTIKLTSGQFQHAYNLMVKHDLTIDNIRRAYESKRVLTEQRWKVRQASAQV